ncbi:MAG: hypothetical protein HY246_03190 [Proteobacteria bacterium]|nr:hypothetical protein [Pseudomonadota bacterium]
MSNPGPAPPPPNFTSWDYLIAHCDGIEGLSPLEREKAKRAFAQLRKVFGNDFLKESYDNNHPMIGWRIANQAPWTRKWCIWFSEAIERAESAKGFSKILERLCDSRRFDEGLSVLDVADRLARAKFSIEFDEPVTIEGTKKIPDLRISNADVDEIFYGEVSVLGQSKPEATMWERFHKVTSIFSRPGQNLLSCGRLLRTLSEESLSEVVNDVEQLISVVQSRNCFQELIRPGVIELAVAPPHDSTILSLWAEQRSLTPNQFSAPHEYVNELGRLKAKFAKKVQQLPIDLPNLLVIQADNLLWNIKNREELITNVEEMVFSHSNLLILVLCSGVIMSPEKLSQSYGMNKYSRIETIYDTSNDYYIFLNKFCTVKITPLTITRIFSAFSI